MSWELSRRKNRRRNFARSSRSTNPSGALISYICGLGQFTTLINGAKVGDHVMDPAWTDYDMTSDYVTFDVTSMVSQGSNAIGVNLANGWLSDARDRQVTRNIWPDADDRTTACCVSGRDEQ